MIPQRARQLRAVLIACMIIVPGLPEVRVAHSTEIATGSVNGTAKLVWGDRTVPLAGARLELMSISDEGGEYQATTDATGRYTIALPPGTYKMRLEWMGGDCAEINRASFRLDAGAHLTFDFLAMQCPISDPVIRRVPVEEQAKKSTQPQGTNAMKVPMTEQTEKYQEQVIPGERNRWSEIIVSFGKYDNQVDEIRYFPRHQTIMNSFAVPDPPIPLSLPVIITVDRYTLQASEVVLNKKTMVFKAKGEVSISDGRTTNNTGTSARLSFSNGLPRLEIKR